MIQDADFDDGAIQMSVTLGYGRADGGEPSANHWINSPDDLDTGLVAVRAVPFVQALLTQPTSTVAATVGHCG